MEKPSILYFSMNQPDLIHDSTSNYHFIFRFLLSEMSRIVTITVEATLK